MSATAVFGVRERGVSRAVGRWPEGTERETGVAACLRQVAAPVTNPSPQPLRDRHATARSAAATQTNTIK